jgi:hypothetical protein
MAASGRYRTVAPHPEFELRNDMSGVLPLVNRRSNGLPQLPSIVPYSVPVGSVELREPSRRRSSMDINAKFEVSVWGVLCVIGVTAVTVAGAAWGLAKATEANELQAYKTAKDWKAAEAIASLQELSKSAKLNADEQNELLTLRRRVPELERALSESSSQLAQTKTEASSLRQTLAALVKNIDQIEIPLRESRYVIPQTVMVGVHTIYTSLNRCGIRVGDRSELLEVGQPFGLPFAGKEYLLTLSKVSETACSFAFAEKSKS